MEYYSTIRKDEHPSFALTWMELKGIMLSEISQAEKDNYHMVSLICGTFSRTDHVLDHKTSLNKLKGEKSERERNHERLWTPETN